MPIRCLNCGTGYLQKGQVQLPGVVKGEEYTVEMAGLACPECGYATIEGPLMAEYRRLLSDKYREVHGLLTSVEIRERRKRLGMNQEQFAHYLGVGVASVKRWEMGKIQDQRNNDLIVERTDPPTSGTAWGSGIIQVIEISNTSWAEPQTPLIAGYIVEPAGILQRPGIRSYLDNLVCAETPSGAIPHGTSIRCDLLDLFAGPRQTADLPPAHLVGLLKENRSYARRRR